MGDPVNPHPNRMVPMAVGLNAEYYRLRSEEHTSELQSH